MGHRLLALGVGGVVLTATVLVGVGAWQTSTFASAASDSVAAIGRADAANIGTGAARLTASVG
jgi:methyl-accepting chemotaxis protein